MALKPKHLILNLLLDAKEPISSQTFIRVCNLFDITDNSARVTLARLCSENMVAACGRGLYQLGPDASSLAADLSRWRELDEKLCEWDGAWIGVYVGMIGRTDRTALKRRGKILQLAGFEELEQGLLVRPNNLIGGVSALRDRLYSLGLERDALVFKLDDFDENSKARARALWDIDSLNQHYAQAQEVMSDWMARAPELDPDTAAKESFLIGDEYLRCIAYDPMLPPQMVDVVARRKYLDTMIEYEQLGKAIWQKLLSDVRQAVSAP